MTRYILTLILVFTSNRMFHRTTALFSDYQGPVSVVEMYCNKDFYGARLSSDSWEMSGIDNLSTWGSDEPGWDYTIIVGGYRIESTTKIDTAYVVHVKYDILGLISGSHWENANQSDVNNPLQIKWANTMFTLVHIHDQWLINAPLMPPHVAPEIMLQHLRMLQSNSNPNSVRYKNRAALIDTITTLVHNRNINAIPPVLER